MYAVQSVCLGLLVLLAVPDGVSCAGPGTTPPCDDMRFVRSLNLVVACRNTWSSSDYSLDTSDSCQTCVDGLNDVAVALGRNDKESSVQQTLSRNCSLIANDPARQAECLALIDIYFVELKELVNRAIDRNVVCGLMKMCKKSSGASSGSGGGGGGGSQSFVPLEQTSAADNTKTACSNCRTFVSNFRSLIKNVSNQSNELNRIFFNLICGLAQGQTSRETLSAEKQTCKNAIDQGLPALLQTVADLFDRNGLCPDLGFCQTSPGRGDSRGYGLICTLIADALTIGEKQTIQNAIEAAICSKLQTDFETQCSRSSDRIASEFLIQLFKATDFGNLCENATKNSILSQVLPATSAATSQANDDCSTCSAIVDKISDANLPQDLNEERILGFLDKTCKQVLPSATVDSACGKFKQRINVAELLTVGRRACQLIGCIS